MLQGMASNTRGVRRAATGRAGPHGSWFPAMPDPDAPPVERGTVKRVVRSFRPYRGKVSIVAVAIIITAGLGVANPLLIKPVFETLSGHPIDLGRLYWLVGLMVLIPIVTAVIGIGQTYMANVVGQRVMQDFRNGLYSHLQHMAMRFFTATRTGEIQSRLSNDVGGVQSVVTDTASGILSNVVTIASTLIAMFILSWQLTLLSLALLPVFLVLQRKVGRARQVVAARTQESMADLSAIAEETLSVSGILLSKAFGRQAYEIGRYQTENERLANLQIRQQMIGRSFFAVVGVFFSIMPALVYLVAGIVMHGNPAAGIGLPTIVAFTTLQSRLFFPIGSMLQVSVEVQSSLALFSRIFEYLDMEHEISDAPDAVLLPPERVSGKVGFRHVYFRYDTPPPDDAPEDASEAIARGLADGTVAPTAPLAPDAEASAVEIVLENERPREWNLADVDLEIEPGQLAALVGPSGAGKTTMTYLVPRLYDVTEGAIEIDGVDVRKIKLESLGEIIGVVTQETYLFHTTVRENLLYGRPDATQEQMESAARAAFIHDRIIEMPDRYDTVVGERGYRLSGGEKQRLAIARVVLKDPRILILDEATSSLDTTSERLVQAALDPLMKGRTTIAIAHRLSTILSADVIFVVDRGRIVERGTHPELLARRGLYARLYEQQFQGGSVEAECEDGVVLSSGEIVRSA
jgi:ATP-binding cassette subfamily B protein